jgi:hypothetical protein
MSLENAILEHAAAIRELVAAMVSKGAVLGPKVVMTPAAVEMIADMQPIKTGDAEVEQSVQKVEAAAEEESPKRKAINEALAAARAASAAKEKAPEPKDEEPAPAAAAIDYKTQVYPKLVELGKGKGRAAVVGLLAEFDAKNGDQLKPEQYAKVLARAAELAA